LPETLDTKFVLIICVLAKFLKHRKNQNIASNVAIDAKRLFKLSLENNPPPSGLWYDEGPSCFGRKAVLKMCGLPYQSCELNHTIRIALE
jgi:hypothetical protein